MGNWRRYKGESHYAADHRGRRRSFRKPPLDNRQSSVPQWEKKFFASLCSVSWRKLLETKKYMFLHDNNVVHWDDSAGREAFYNAKGRFWAEINGLPCNISLPDPNIYIDHIDWDSVIDPELLLDLERESNAPTEGVKNEKVVILGDSLLLNQSFSCNGWGEAAEAELANGNRNTHANDSMNSWEVNCAQNDAGKGYGCGNCWDGWNQTEQHPIEAHRMEDRVCGSWETIERPGWYIPPHDRTPDLPSNDYQKNQEWRNGRGRKRSDFDHHQPYTRTISAGR